MNNGDMNEIEIDDEKCDNDIIYGNKKINYEGELINDTIIEGPDFWECNGLCIDCPGEKYKFANCYTDGFDYGDAYELCKECLKEECYKMDCSGKVEDMIAAPIKV